MRNGSGLECGMEMVEVNTKEEPLEQISINPTGENRLSSTHHTRENRKSSQSHSQETKCNSNRWVLGVPLENVMDLGQLAVSRHLDRRDWFVGVAGNRQLECGLIVGFRGAKGSDEETSVDRLGEGEELNREVLLSLSSGIRQLLRRLSNTCRGRPLTRSTLDLPLSFTLNGYEISKPVSGSLMRRKT